MKRKTTIAHILGKTESFSRNEPIANKKLKGKATKGMVKVAMGDNNNTVIYCENEKEAERVMPIYKAAMMNTAERSRMVKVDKDLADIDFKHLHHT